MCAEKKHVHMEVAHTGGHCFDPGRSAACNVACGSENARQKGQMAATLPNQGQVPVFIKGSLPQSRRRAGLQNSKRHIQCWTRKGFFKKKHSCGFSFSKLCHTPIFLIHVNIFSIKWNHSSMTIFSIYIHTCPVNIHCHFNCTDWFRAEI